MIEGQSAAGRMKNRSISVECSNSDLPSGEATSSMERHMVLSQDATSNPEKQKVPEEHFDKALWNDCENAFSRERNQNGGTRFCSDHSECGDLCEGRTGGQ